MKILWISYFGSWTRPLLDELSKNHDVSLIVPSSTEAITTENNVKVYNIKISLSEATNNLSAETYAKYQRIINLVKPHIIHVHGTEKNLGQIQKYIQDVPVVVSIQGILSGYIAHSSGYLREENIKPYRTIKNLLGKGGYREPYKKCIQGRDAYEKDILSNGRYFFCRTNWDKAWVMFSNPKAKIYHGEELLRQPFYDNSGSWKYDSCVKRTIFMPSGFNPIKGLHIALKAVALLKKFYPDVTLVVPGLPKHILEYDGVKSRLFGEEFINYCKDIIRKEGIGDNVVLLERLDANGMVNEMKKANVFLSPSTIDNSPNAVGEATMIGMPVVSTPVGGTTTFLRDEKNCLLASSGDEYIIAYQIKRIFEDPVLAISLGQSAYQTALMRHDKKITVKQYIDAYADIIMDYRK